ncbi:MAG: glutathione S-transferase family protein [Actinobacteria bacterium]|nr:glutathione S-transferase family protein [Actinomycetota bacterium]
MKLYDYPASANCFKVRLLLALLDRPYERVPVDIFAGESSTAAYLAKNPAGRTPLVELPSGETVAESNAILLYLGEGTRFVPEGLEERARVWAWLFFEQNLFEPNVGTARFWRLTGRDAGRHEEWESRRLAGIGALEALERGLTGREWLVGDAPTVADIALYAYAHVAHEAGIEMAPYGSVAGWLARVQAEPGFVNDLVSYPAGARAGSASGSVHDRAS